MFYKAVYALIYIYMHTYTCVYTRILFQTVVTGRIAIDAEINVYVTLQRIVRSSPEKQELLPPPKQGLLLNTLT